MNADLAAAAALINSYFAVPISVGAFPRKEGRERRKGDEADAAEPKPGAAGIGGTGIGGTVTGSAGETPMKGHAETTERGSAPRQ